eukprot:scaffold92819_cov34-Phaeocystis_antarctica.AAC.2
MWPMVYHLVAKLHPRRSEPPAEAQRFWAVGAVCGPGGPRAAIPPVRLQACLGALAGRVYAC